jgi:hypothetical protein
MSEKKDEEQNRKTDRVIHILAIISAIFASIIYFFGGDSE